MNNQQLSSLLSQLTSSLTGLSKSLPANLSQSQAAGISSTLSGLSSTLTGVSKSIGSGPAPQTPSSSATTIQASPTPQQASKSVPGVTLDSLTKYASSPASAPASAPSSAAPASYVPFTGYGAPTGWTATTTNLGGTAYKDAQGNIYTPVAGGFQLYNAQSAPQALPQYQDANGQIYTSNGGPKVATDTPMNAAALAATGKGQATPTPAQPTAPASTPAPTSSTTTTPTSGSAPVDTGTTLKSAGVPTANLQPGQSGTDVTALQQFLVSNGYSIPDGVTGYYGSQTQAAVAQLQKDLGMTLDPSEQGYFGPKTQQALAAAISGSSSGASTPAASAPSSAVAPGTNNDPLSQALAALGLPPQDSDILQLLMGPGSALSAEKAYLDQATKQATEEAKGSLAIRGLLGTGVGDKELADTLAQLGASNASSLAQLQNPYIQDIFSLLTMKPTIIPQGAIAIDPRTGSIIQTGQPRITSIPFGATPAYSGPTVGGGGVSSGGGGTPTGGGGNSTYTNSQASLLGLSDQQAQTLTKLGVPSDIWGTIAGIVTGQLPPNSSTRSAAYQAAVNKGLVGLGFNVAKATTEWNATQKWVASANSPTQLRLRQAITSVNDALGNLSTLNDQWKRAGFTPLNSAILQSAISGAFGPDAQSIATQFQQQMTVVQDELGQTFMGGNSPTDKALELASKALSGSWSQQQLSDAITNLQTNLGFRANAIDSTGPNGGGAYSTAAPSAVPGTATYYVNQPYGFIFNDGTMQYTAMGDGTAMGSDGNIYVDDGSGNLVPQ